MPFCEWLLCAWLSEALYSWSIELFCVLDRLPSVDLETQQTYKLEDGVTTFPYVVMGNPSFVEVGTRAMVSCFRLEQPA
jgi:hypothetical protein